MIRSDMEAAFRATSYRVDTDGGCFDLRLDEKNQLFDEFLRRRKVSNWGVITAHNPGAPIAATENRARHERLRQALVALGVPFCPAVNIADDGRWPDEDGFMVFEVEQETICDLARTFGQLAFVWGGDGNVPRLRWTALSNDARQDTASSVKVKFPGGGEHG